MKHIDIPLEKREWLTITEFCTAAGVSNTAILRWIKGGYLDATRYSPKCIMLRRTELELYLSGGLMERHRLRTVEKEARE
jgi:predicted site-specific integrase-resolvase